METGFCAAGSGAPGLVPCLLPLSFLSFLYCLERVEVEQSSVPFLLWFRLGKEVSHAPSWEPGQHLSPSRPQLPYLGWQRITARAKGLNATRLLQWQQGA